MMRIAILGCGQLSRMLALSGIPFGFNFSFIADPEEDSVCVENLGTLTRWDGIKPAKEIYEELGQPDVITVEKEQVNVDLLTRLEEFCPVYPNTKAFAICQHRYFEKQLLDSLQIPTSAYTYSKTADESSQEISLPMVAKSCRDGYDGKNQWVIKTSDDIETFDSEQDSSKYIIEKFIPFDAEVSQVSVRSRSGEISHYPLTENVHEKGILKQSIAPATCASVHLSEIARDYISRIMESLDYVGVMAMECFMVGDSLLVNELAPRVHNSGHWTQAGTTISQFENHIRAIAGLPLGSTENKGFVGMLNLIGTKEPPLKALTRSNSLHWYNKSVRPGRKLGHVNFTGDSADAVFQEIRHFQKSCAD